MRIDREDVSESIRVRNIMKRQRADGQVDLQGIQSLGEAAVGGPARQNLAQRFKRQTAWPEVFQIADMLSAIDILAHDNAHEGGMGRVDIEGCADQFAQSLQRGQGRVIDRPFYQPEFLVSPFQNRRIQPFLAVEVIVNHVLAGVGPGGNVPHTGT